MQTLARYIEAHAEEPLSLKKLSTRVHLSPAHLQRTFKNVVGISPKAFHDASRLRLLKGALKAGKSVLESKMLQRLGYPRHLRSGQQAKKSLYPDLIGAGADVLGALLRLKLGKTITQGCPSG
jgi:methylphosphotriester-DNA--protein-cysteine methyltransferase